VIRKVNLFIWLTSHFEYVNLISRLICQQAFYGVRELKVSYG